MMIQSLYDCLSTFSLIYQNNCTHSYIDAVWSNAFLLPVTIYMYVTYNSTKDVMSSIN